MRNEEIMIDLADPVFTKTIRSRQNDKNGLKLTVYVREKGEKVDLTGYVVKYEATNHTGVFIRDDAQIVDAKNGVFLYSFTSQAVSTSDDWTAYFVMEKSTERMSTPDIRITLRRDVKEGNIKIENYISEFDKALEMVKGYQKQIDEANKRINELTAAVTGQKYQLWKVTGDDGHTIPLDAKTDLNSVIKTGVYRGNSLVNAPAGANWWYIQVYSHSDGAYSCMQVAYSLDSSNLKSLYIRKKASNVWTNWERQAIFSEVISNNGDNSMMGSLYIDRNSNDAPLVIANKLGKMRFLPHNNDFNYIQSGTLDDKAKNLFLTGYNGSTMDKVQVKTNEFIVEGILKQATDTGWINLATTGVENVPDRILKYKRSGDQITVIGSVRNPANTTIFTVLPVGFRPVQNIAFPALAYGNGPTVCEVTVKSDGGIFVNGVQSGNTIHIAMNFLI
ncbi:phage protein [Bacillus thuringiensis]|uniref:BppU family phage baseplate upper protein n=1 Tax=Bacillus thuringiensis TaxID=1428 RepID=UPI0018CEE3EA|nr:BppU family phage baseplate upper protein [Bacillus thuringiensis]MBG9500961.1 phage protein [Bacillus thuringiensis]